MLHRDHPWLGRAVTDTATGRRGTLRAIAPDGDKPRPVAWLQPPGGGGVDHRTRLPGRPRTDHAGHRRVMTDRRRRRRRRALPWRAWWQTWLLGAALGSE
ncbi:hypothetical protein ACH4FA_36570 [Streptomyces sp. NPDC017966]|uniref:hypothetical protein n=1 Tax=Streptomyces sp. NPDC017966 TaxID=3365023 RepID=UPI00378726D4